MFAGCEPADLVLVPSRKMGHTPSQPNQKRRAVLRGSLAAPVVLTVSSPAAAVSSLRRCLNNQNAQNAGPFLSASEDTWLRKPVDVHKLEKSEGNDKGNDKRSTSAMISDRRGRHLAQVDALPGLRP